VSPIQLQKYHDEYGIDKVNEAIRLLTYKNVSPLPKEESIGRPTLYVFRHGQTTDNADFLYSGWRDVELTEEGRRQAETLSEKLKDKKIDMLVSSDQKRAIETMNIAMAKNEHARNLEIHKDPRLRERSYGDLQGTSKLEAFLENPDTLHKQRRDYNFVPPNGESIAMVVKRVGEFLDELLPFVKENKLNVAIACSGNSIRGIRKRFENLTDEETAAVETPLGQDYAAYRVEPGQTRN